jgi:hypothetical protein
MRRLMLHEAQIHAVPGRVLRDLDDSVLLYDPVEPEPFWNRLECLRWPSDAAAFDRRVTETMVLFGSIGRQPHIWATPLHDSPPDVVERLVANGFRDTGKGNLMVLADPPRAVLAAQAPLPDGVTIERLSMLAGPAATDAAGAVTEVLVDAFDVDDVRREGVEAETVVSLGHPWFTHYLVRLGGTPAAVAKRATFDDTSYLSSIGTASWARGRGLGHLVTALAAADSLALGTGWTYLGVFAENTVAVRVYERTGFVRLGQSCPDLLLI